MAGKSMPYEDDLHGWLQDPVNAAGYLAAVLEENDADTMLVALRDVAKAQGGMTAVADLQPRVPETDYIPHEVVNLHFDQDMIYLKAWREYLGFTQAEVAEKAGISRAALSQMESGESRLRKATREKLAAAMGINASQLL